MSRINPTIFAAAFLASLLSLPFAEDIHGNRTIKGNLVVDGTATLGGYPIAVGKVTTGSIDVPSVVSGRCSPVQNVPVTGAVFGDSVFVSQSSGDVTDGGFITAHVHSEGAVDFQYCNNTNGNIDPPPQTFSVRVIR